MGIYISKLTDSPSAAVNTQSQPQANGEFKALMNEFSPPEIRMMLTRRENHAYRTSCGWQPP